MLQDTLTAALKEWAVTQRSLLEGHQIILLRKGGIVEETGDFDLKAKQFLIYPTYAHETERAGGGEMEALGGLCYTTTAGKLAPMFVAADSAMSVTLGEVCYSGNLYEIIVRQTRRGTAKEFPAASPDYKRRLVLYAGGANAAP